MMPSLISTGFMAAPDVSLLPLSRVTRNIIRPPRRTATADDRDDGGLRRHRAAAFAQADILQFGEYAGRNRLGHHRDFTALVSTACTCANTNTPAECTSGSGMLSERASIQIVRLNSHGTMAAGWKLLGLGCVLTVISSEGEDEPARDRIRLPRT